MYFLRHLTLTTKRWWSYYIPSSSAVSWYLIEKKAPPTAYLEGKNCTAVVDGNSRKGIFSFVLHLMENQPISLCCILSGPLDIMPRSITCSFFTSHAFKFDSSIQNVKQKFTSRHNPNVTKGSKSHSPTKAPLTRQRGPLLLFCQTWIWMRMVVFCLVCVFLSSRLCF